jgi:LSD1 subclass zinc finger protein
MFEDVRTLKCPACGATLDPPQGQSSMKCSYCQSTVEIPAAAQAPASAPFPYDANIGKILALARSGERIRAVNMVREITGNTSLSDAAEIVDAIVRGEEVEL